MIGGIPRVPQPCFLTSDLMCGGAQMATLRWSSWLPQWVRERTTIAVQQWPEGRWDLADLAASDPRVAKIVRDVPYDATVVVCSNGEPYFDSPYALILHNCNPAWTETACSRFMPASVYGVSYAAAKAHQGWLAAKGLGFHGVVRPPHCLKTDTARVFPRLDFGPGECRPVRVLYRSRLEAHKGAKALVAMLRRCPEMLLEVQSGVDPQGRGDHRQSQEQALQQLIQEAASSGVLDRLKVSGFCYELEPMSMLRSAPDVLLLPSRAEGYGLVVAEAKHAGIPVAATAVGGVPEILTGEFAEGLFEWSEDSEVLAGNAVEAIRKVQRLPLPSGFSACDWAGNGRWWQCLPTLLRVCGASLNPRLTEVEVTVGVRVHVGAQLHLLDECLGSLAGQNYANFTTLLCVDGLHDDAARLAERYGLPFVCTNKAPHVQQMSMAHRLGLQACETTYYKPLDYDDLLFDSYLRTAVHKLSHSGADLFTCPVLGADFFGEILGPQDGVEAVFDSLGDDLADCPFAHSSVTLRADSARRVGGYAEKAPNRGDDDLDLWRRMYRAGLKLLRGEYRLVAYRHHREQATHWRLRQLGKKLTPEGLICPLES